jgi:aromatic-L-amino-acid/L-tryptophan decarboxylase
VALLAARSRIFNEKKAHDPTLTLGRLLDQLVVYCSDQAHSSVDKAVLILGSRLRKISTDADCVMRGEQLEAAIAEDRAQGLIPFFLVATLGTTPTVDNIVIIIFKRCSLSIFILVCVR